MILLIALYLDYVTTHVPRTFLEAAPPAHTFLDAIEYSG